MRTMIDLLGQRFGRLTAISYAGMQRDGKQNYSFWCCHCDCGGRVIVRASHLRSGETKSCGCYRVEKLRARMLVESVVHGDNRRRTTGVAFEYHSWSNMIQRCENANNKGYKYYGGRGIKVCERWRASYPTFLADLGRRPSPQHSLDRIDNNGHYEPGNVRWATAKQQANNRREPGHAAEERQIA